LVNLRVALRMLVEARVIDKQLKDMLLAIAKGQFYLDRRIETLLNAAERRSLITDQKARQVVDFLADKNFDLKRADALEVINTLVSLIPGR
ncbi:MAG: hypothetical protein ACXV48_06925, partial [Halobacteriota archaeon]